MIYGYIRVSTKDQNEDRQIVAMREFGVKKFYIEKRSGKDFNRPHYKMLINKLKTGDVLVVKSIDRFGRNYEEILEQWRFVTKTKGADIVVLDMPLLDTRKGKDLIGTLISDIVLQLLSYVAQTEREFIKQRQREGIDAAKARGVRFGHAPMDRPAEYGAVCALWRQGEISAREAGRRLNITYKTFLRWARKDSELLSQETLEE